MRLSEAISFLGRNCQLRNNSLPRAFSRKNMSDVNGVSGSGSGLKRVTKPIDPPFNIEGEVIKGFGRGSKEIGCPTANFDETVVESLPDSFGTGIYFGWAKIDDDEPVRKACVSIGWNPYYNNSKKSIETHIMHKYSENFYGSWLRLSICGYIRPEQDFISLDGLITAIQEDIKHSDEALDKQPFKSIQSSDFFSKTVKK